MTLPRWPYPRMYQFLLDDFYAHLAKAEQASQMRDYAKYFVELEKARSALSDFQMLLDEFKLAKG